MQIQDFFGILIVGVLVSLVVDWAKAKFGVQSLKTKLLVVGLSILTGGFYFLFRETPWFQSMVGVLTSASAVYALILKKE